MKKKTITPTVTRIQVEGEGLMLMVRTEFEKRLPEVFKSLGGKWDAVKKVWFLKTEHLTVILPLLLDVFDVEPELIDRPTETTRIERVKGVWRKPEPSKEPATPLETALLHVTSLVKVFEQLTVAEREKIVSHLIDKVGDL